MKEENKTIATLEKIKSFAMTLIGAGIFSMGTTYFSEQSEYRVPRILLPVYELFGNIGLAVGMIILGAGLMYFAYRKYVQNNGKPVYMLVFSLLAIIGFYGLILSTNQKKTVTIDDLKATLEKNQQKTDQEIMNTERPNLDSDLANKYIVKLERLEQKFKKSVDEKDRDLFDECEGEYDTMITVDFGNVVEEISKTPEYKDFAMYNAKVSKRIQVFREHKW